jgi:hypothetical protein
MNPLVRIQYRRVTSKFFSVSSIEAVSANTFTGHSCPALTAQFIRPRALGMVLAHPANAETDLAVRVDHETSLTGWRRYASIAQFERTSLRRSPDLSIPRISSSKKFADQFGSLSSPDFSRTLQAIAKDCSMRSVSVMRRNGFPTDMFLNGGGQANSKRGGRQVSTPSRHCVR